MSNCVLMTVLGVWVPVPHFVGDGVEAQGGQGLNWLRVDRALTQACWPQRPCFLPVAFLVQSPMWNAALREWSWLDALGSCGCCLGSLEVPACPCGPPPCASHTPGQQFYPKPLSSAHSGFFPAP